MARELAVVLVNASLKSTVACALAGQRHRTVLLGVETSTSPTVVAANQQRFEALVAQVKPYRSYRVALPTVATARGDGAISAASTGGGVADRLLDQLPIVACGLRLAAHAGATALYAGHRVGPEAADLSRVTEHAQIWGELVQVTCDRPTLEIQLPLLELEPWQVVDLAVQVNAPLQLSWDCEHNGEVPCGACGGCQSRDAAFQRSGRPDPLRPAAKGR